MRSGLELGTCSSALQHQHSSVSPSIPPTNSARLFDRLVVLFRIRGNNNRYPAVGGGGEGSVKSSACLRFLLPRRNYNIFIFFPLFTRVSIMFVFTFRFAADLGVFNTRVRLPLIYSKLFRTRINHSKLFDSTTYMQYKTGTLVVVYCSGIKRTVLVGERHAIIIIYPYIVPPEIFYGNVKNMRRVGRYSRTVIKKKKRLLLLLLTIL